MRGDTRATLMGIPILGLLFLAATSLLLVLDLKRPERFHYILLRPNWSSWLVKGTYALMAYGALLSVWLVLGYLGHTGPWFLRLLTVAAAFLAASYTSSCVPFWIMVGSRLPMIISLGKYSAAFSRATS